MYWTSYIIIVLHLLITVVFCQSVSYRKTRPACVWFCVAVMVWLILLLGFLLGLRDVLKRLSKVPECERGGPALCWVSLAVRRAQKQRVGLSGLWWRVWGGKGFLGLCHGVLHRTQLRVISLRALITARSH